MKFIGVLLFFTALCICVIAAPDSRKTVSMPSATNALKKANDFPRQSLCRSNQFECSNGQCINKNLVCNDRNDCRDGSDESFSECFSTGGKTTTSTTQGYMDISVSQSDFTCADDEFLCTSGECILQSRICDERRDCRDGSDELSTICHIDGSGTKKKCLSTEFRCNSGECIHQGMRCDGSNDCYDSSDEDFGLCQRINAERRPQTPSRPERLPSIPLQMAGTEITEPNRLPPCDVPSQPANGRWKLHRSQCDSNNECNPPANLRSMEPGTYLVYTCDQGFRLNGSRDVLCGPGGQWIHEPRCDEIRCNDLSSSTTEALCTWNNVAVSCEVPAPIGTTAQLKCREGFVQEVMYEHSYKSVKCEPNGKWSPNPIQCVKKPKKVKLVLEGDMIIED